MKDHNGQEVTRDTYLHAEDRNLHQVVNIGDGVLRHYTPRQTFSSDELPPVLTPEVASHLIRIIGKGEIMLHLQRHEHSLLREVDFVPVESSESYYAQRQPSGTEEHTSPNKSSRVKHTRGPFPSSYSWG